MSKIIIYDTTLRDGSQTEGVSYTVADKVKITEKLDELGVHYVEGGWPGSNPKDKEYFELMKKYTPEEHWNSEVEKLIHLIENKEKNLGYSRELIRKIYIKQQWWDRLFNLLKQTESLQNIEQEEPYLKNDYAPELVEMYSKRLVNYIEKHVAREHYKTACNYLRRMKKLGGDSEVNKLIEYFRKTYPMRKALIDELSRV